MSEVFEGVLSLAGGEVARQIASGLLQGIPLETGAIGEGVAVVFRANPRQKAAFSEEMETLAAALSRSDQPALLIRYDSRVGYRSANLYRNGRLDRTFTTDDEIWVPLDEAGELVLDGPQCRAEDLDGEREYGTLRDVFDLGLDSLQPGLGGTARNDLYDFMTAH